MLTEKETKALEIMSDPHLAPQKPVFPDGVVLGISCDVVYMEIIELFRLRLSSILQVPESAIDCRVTVEQGKVMPEVNIDLEKAEGATAEQVKEVIQSVWWGVPPVRSGIRDELIERLQDLGTTRAREKKEEAQS
jgi:hypothetical protein